MKYFHFSLNFFFIFKSRNKISICYKIRCFYGKVKNKPFSFLEVKSKPNFFSAISRARKPDFCRKLRNTIWKECFRKIHALKNTRFCAKTPFCFLMEKHLLKNLNNFLCCDHDCASITAHSSENFNTRILIYIYFKTVLLLPQKHLI